MKLTANEIEAALEGLPGWRLEKAVIVKEFKFNDFRDAFDYMIAVSKEAERLNHHPDWSNSYNTVNVSLSTHSQGGVTTSDLVLAKKMNELAER